MYIYIHIYIYIYIHLCVCVCVCVGCEVVCVFNESRMSRSNIKLTYLFYITLRYLLDRLFLVSS